jgi:hypothetical protein
MPTVNLKKRHNHLSYQYHIDTEIWFTKVQLAMADGAM